MNARALDHKGTMVDVYSKLKPDSFTSQLQTVLTTYYEDIMPVGVQGASGCNKAKVVKCKFEDQLTCAGRGRVLLQIERRALASSPPARGRGIRTRRGGACSGPQPWGQERGRQGGEGSSTKRGGKA